LISPMNNLKVSHRRFFFTILPCLIQWSSKQKKILSFLGKYFNAFDIFQIRKLNCSICIWYFPSLILWVGNHIPKKELLFSVWSQLINRCKWSMKLKLTYPSSALVGLPGRSKSRVCGLFYSEKGNHLSAVTVNNN
jgi:hypothetical protein